MGEWAITQSPGSEGLRDSTRDCVLVDRLAEVREQEFRTWNREAVSSSGDHHSYRTSRSEYEVTTTSLCTIANNHAAEACLGPVSEEALLAELAPTTPHNML